MKTIKAERITKDNFAPYGRYYNVFEERKTESEDFTAYMLRVARFTKPYTSEAALALPSVRQGTLTASAWSAISSPKNPSSAAMATWS